MSTSDPNSRLTPNTSEPASSDRFEETARLRFDAKDSVQRSLLDDVLRETSAAANLTESQDDVDLEALRQIGRIRRGEPFSEDPIARELIESVLIEQFRDHWNTPGLWRPIAKRIAQTLCTTHLKDREVFHKVKRPTGAGLFSERKLLLVGGPAALGRSRCSSPSGTTLGVSCRGDIMTSDRPTTQQLIEQCQGLVRSLARSIHRKLPPQTDFEDLVAYGQIGLSEAAGSFDPSRGSRFSTYAYYRIRGAIYDGLSKMAWFSRSQYHQIRSEQTNNELLQVENEEDTEQVGGSTTKSTDVRADVRWLGNVTRSLAMVQLITSSQEEDDKSCLVLVDDSTPTAAATVMSEEICQRLHELIDSLPDEPRTLIQATYFEGLSLREAGERLGISKSWASRLHAKTLKRLAQSLKRCGVAP